MRRLFSGASIYALILTISLAAIVIVALVARWIGFPKDRDGVSDSVIIEIVSFIITVAVIGSASAWVQDRIEQSKRRALEAYANTRLRSDLKAVLTFLESMRGMAIPEPAVLTTDVYKLDGIPLHYRPLSIDRLKAALRDLEQQVRELRALIGEIGFVIPIEERDHLFSIGYELSKVPRHASWIIESHANHFLDGAPLPDEAPRMPEWPVLKQHIAAVLKGGELGPGSQPDADAVTGFSEAIAKAYLRTDESLIKVSDRYEGIIARSERYELAIAEGRIPNYLRRAERPGGVSGPSAV